MEINFGLKPASLITFSPMDHLNEVSFAKPYWRRERFEVRSLLFWDVKQCRLVVGYQSFGTAYPSRLQGLRSPSKCQELDK